MNFTGTNSFNVAIVGGGIAGLYAAYRLREAWIAHDKSFHEALANRLQAKGDTLHVVILEQDPIRWGGRLCNVELPFPGGSVIAEMGAMRFTTRQRLLRTLLRDLNVRTIPFQSDNFFTRYFLRGKYFGVRDIERNNQARFPYKLKGIEIGQGPTSLLSHVLEKTLYDLSLDSEATPKTLLALEKLRGRLSRDTLTCSEWADIRNHGLLSGQVRLENIGMWNLIHHHLSTDAAHFVEDGFGYESIIGNWNVSDAIPWFIADFGPGQSYETIEKGFSHLIERILETLAPNRKMQCDVWNDDASKTFRCELVLNARVDELWREKLSSGETMLHLSTTKAYPEYKRECEQTNNRIFCNAAGEIQTKIVILALPKLSLEQMNVDRIVKNKRSWIANLAKVRPHRLMKIVHAYRNAWWRTIGIPKGSCGQVFTDLPLRQVYYFDRGWLEERSRYKYYDSKGDEIRDLRGRVSGGSEPKPEVGGMVIAYLDGHYASFWRFITAVQRIQNLADDKRTFETTDDAIDRAIKKEQQKRGQFGKRIFGWNQPLENLIEMNKKPVESWSDEQRARHLYFHRYGLYERASTKMTHILKDLHASFADSSEHTVVPDPVAGAYVLWENFDDGFAAGWHTWEPGVNSAAAIKQMIQPFEGQDIFVCGEAYSSEQGWVEGALKSVELVMDRLNVMTSSELPNVESFESKKDPDGIRDYIGLPPRNVDNHHSFRHHQPVPISANQSIVFLSGQIGLDTSSLEPVSIEIQTAEALRRLGEELKQAGGIPTDLVVIRVFLTSMDNYERFNKAYSRAAQQFGHLPACTTVGVNALPYGALVEVEGIAVVKSNDNVGKSIVAPFANFSFSKTKEEYPGEYSR